MNLNSKNILRPRNVSIILCKSHLVPNQPLFLLSGENLLQIPHISYVTLGLHMTTVLKHSRLYSLVVHSHLTQKRIP